MRIPLCPGLEGEGFVKYGTNESPCKLGGAFAPANSIKVGKMSIKN